MSKITEHNGYLLVEVPSIAFGFDINNYGDNSEFMFMLDVEDIIDEPHHDETLITKTLPPGNYSIIGKGDVLNDEDWEGIVEVCVHMENFEELIKDGWWNYEKEEFPLETATQSGLSLLASKGFKPECTLVLRKH